MSNLHDFPDTDQMRETYHRPRRYLDLRISLMWALGVAGAFAMFLATMYFKLDAVGTEVTDLKTAVSIGNTQSTTLSKDVAILSYRQDVFERELARLNNEPIQKGQQ